MCEGQNSWAQIKMTAVIGVCESELLKRVEAAADGGARKRGAYADLGDRKLLLAIGEGLNYGQAAGQRGHEIRIAGKSVDFRGRTGWRNRWSAYRVDRAGGRSDVSWLWIRSSDRRPGGSRRF